MTAEDKSFSVKDRRLFSSDGRLRADDNEPETGASPTTAAQAPGGEVDFVGFLLSLGAQAHEALHAKPPALQAARTTIAILELLGAKSEGNRTAEESDVLQDLLYQLRMAYVERSRMGQA